MKTKKKRRLEGVVIQTIPPEKQAHYALFEDFVVLAAGDYVNVVETEEWQKMGWVESLRRWIADPAETPPILLTSTAAYEVGEEVDTAVIATEMEDVYRPVEGSDA